MVNDLGDNMPDLVHRERTLSYLLRHDHKNYHFDIHAWREVCDLIRNHGYSFGELEYIVANSRKKRFEFSEDKLWIRALYGHSFEVDLQLEPSIPPECLFHGTVIDKVPSIKVKGLLPMSRFQVHLSSDEAAAREVGARRKGEVLVLKVAALKAWEAGHLFWHTKNNVWLTRFVPPEYILS